MSATFIEPTDKVIRSVAVRLNPGDQNPTKVPLGALADNIKLDTNATISPIIGALQPFDMPENVQEFAINTKIYLNDYLDRFQQIDMRIANMATSSDDRFQQIDMQFSNMVTSMVTSSDIANMVTFNEQRSIVEEQDVSDYSNISNSIVFGDQLSDNSLVGAHNIVFGDNNIVNQHYAVTVGNGNTLTGYYSLTIGIGNISHGHRNVSIGYDNDIQGNNTYCFGHDNMLTSTSDTIVYGLIGTGLEKNVNPIKSGLICGQYNDHVDDQSHVFSVGIGDDENSRKTGFFVNTNGSAYVDGNFRVGQAVADTSVAGVGTILSRALHVTEGTQTTSLNVTGESAFHGYLEIDGNHLIDNNAVDILHGNLRLRQGTVIGSGGDYAEYIKPWYDNNLRMQDRSGYMVTIKNGALQKAGIDDHIIGITSKTPSIIGNSRAIPEDDNPDTWSCVGLRGFVEVYDDGSCEPETFCKCGGNGIATKADTQGFETYFVIERVSENKILVEVK